MALEFWLRGNGVELRLPVNPEANEYESPFEYDDYEVEALGEVTTVKRRGLRTYTLSSFFPRDYNPTYCEYSDFPSPQNCINRIEEMRNKREPVQYIVTGEGGVNLQVTIRNLSVRAEPFGNPGDIYYTLELKEFRDVKVTVVDTSKPATAKKGTTASRPASSAKPAATAKSYTVKKDDSLWKIAAQKSIYGSGSQWRKIYDANKKVIGADPNKLKVGTKLVIPR